MMSVDSYFSDRTQNMNGHIYLSIIDYYIVASIK